jgi:hypothetical protein
MEAEEEVSWQVVMEQVYDVKKVAKMFLTPESWCLLEVAYQAECLRTSQSRQNLEWQHWVQSPRNQIGRVRLVAM